MSQRPSQILPYPQFRQEIERLWPQLEPYTINNAISYGATGNGSTDDTTAVQKALDAANAAGGGTIYFPAGTYVVGNLNLYSNTVLYGDGPASVLKQKSGSPYCISINSDSDGTADPIDNIANVRLTGLQLLGTVVDDDFSEFYHLLNLNACSHVMVDNCYLTGWRGDGIYIGSGNVAATERHNLDITIRDCVFDGVTKDNRNPISVIDCQHLTVENCYFTRCGKSTMPGGITIEPDNNVFHRLRDINIIGNYFTDNDGNQAAVQIYLSRNDYTLSPQDFWIVSNHVNCSAGAHNGFNVIGSADTTYTSPDLHVMIKDNYTYQVANDIYLDGVRGVTIEGNLFRQSTAQCYVGYNYNCTDLTVRNNTWDYGSTGNGYLWMLYTVKRVRFEGNKFLDVGKSDGTVGVPIRFVGSQVGNYVDINGNTWSNDATSRITKCILKDSGYTLTDGEGRFAWNTFDGCSGNDFAPTYTDGNI